MRFMKRLINIGSWPSGLLVSGACCSLYSPYSARPNASRSPMSRPSAIMPISELSLAHSVGPPRPPEGCSPVFLHLPPEFAERTLRNIRLCEAGSLRLDAGQLDHLAPLLGVVGDELTELGRRARKHRAAEVDKACFQPGIGGARIDPDVELVNESGWRVFRRMHADPLAPLEARHEIANGRDVR